MAKGREGKRKAKKDGQKMANGELHKNPESRNVPVAASHGTVVSFTGFPIKNLALVMEFAVAVC